jgi:hypothetical protein
MEYYTQLQPNGYGVNPGDPTMFSYWVNSYSDVTTPGSIGALSISSPGVNYVVGVYPALALTGGSGSGATATIVVKDLPGPVTGLSQLSAGSGYPVGVAVNDAPTTALTGSGSGLLVDILASLAPPYGAVLGGIGSSGGDGYEVGDTVEPVYGTGTGAVYQVLSVSTTGTVTGLSIESEGNDYAPGDALSATIPGGSGFSATVTNTNPTTFNPRWAQVPHRFNQFAVSNTTPPQYVNNPSVIQYSFMYPVADSITPPPIGSL